MFDREKDVVQPIMKRLTALNFQPSSGWLPLLKMRRAFHLMYVQGPWQLIINRVCEYRV
jgi:hypothetical protein